MKMIKSVLLKKLVVGFSFSFSFAVDVDVVAVVADVVDDVVVVDDVAADFVDVFFMNQMILTSFLRHSDFWNL